MKAEKKVLVVLFFLWAVIIFLSCYFYSARKSTQNPEESIEKIDSLDSKIDSIYSVQDSIYERIDTVYIEIQDNQKEYEKDINDIVDNDADEDLRFFLDYISSNRERLDSISNSVGH